jgi:hypothetical protein
MDPSALDSSAPVLRSSLTGLYFIPDNYASSTNRSSILTYLSQSNIILYFSILLHYCSIGFEVILPSACSFIVDVSLSYI